MIIKPGQRWNFKSHSGVYDFIIEITECAPWKVAGTVVQSSKGSRQKGDKETSWTITFDGEPCQPDPGDGVWQYLEGQDATPGFMVGQGLKPLEYIFITCKIA